MPKYWEIMLPLLQLLGDGQEYTLGGMIEHLATHFKLSAAERAELLPSQGERSFDNRVGWARFYLTKAGLLERTARGRYRITSLGRQVLENPPPYINPTFLEQFPGFREFLQKSRQPLTTNDEMDAEAAEVAPPPLEVLEARYQELRHILAQDLLEQVKSCSPSFFEKLVVDLLVKMGYGGSRKDAGRAIGQSGDGGIDGIIKEDQLGLDAVYIQAKRWEGAVGRPVVQAFAGALEGQKARKGVLITTSAFSRDAKEYVQRIEKRIVLIDGEQLTQYMIDYNIGVTETNTYVIKRVDTDYFEGGG